MKEIIGAGTFFRLGEHKLDDFSSSEAKIGEKQSRQSNLKYNFMRYVLFKKGISSVRWGLAEAGEFSRIFALKVTLQCKL